MRFRNAAVPLERVGGLNVGVMQERRESANATPEILQLQQQEREQRNVERRRTIRAP